MKTKSLQVQNYTSFAYFYHLENIQRIRFPLIWLLMGSWICEKYNKILSVLPNIWHMMVPWYGFLDMLEIVYKLPQYIKVYNMLGGMLDSAI